MQKSDPLGHVWFIDVGQGDSTLIMDAATRKGLLIDCPSSSVGSATDLIRENNVILDTVIITHWDIDHYGGISRIAQSVPVNAVYYNHDTLFENDSSNKFIRTTLNSLLDIPEPNRVLKHAVAGIEGTVGRAVKWKLLAPTQAEITSACVARRRNVASAVADVEVGAVRVLIGGDAVGSTWTRLLSDGSLSANILRWPHHGAHLAGDEQGDIRQELLRAVNPEHVIISAGTRNRYGHPAAETIVAARSVAASVKCTQVNMRCLAGDNAQDAEKGGGPTRQDTPCAGTVYVQSWADNYSVFPTEDTHLKTMTRWDSPMCLSKL